MIWVSSYFGLGPNLALFPSLRFPASSSTSYSFLRIGLYHPPLSHSLSRSLLVFLHPTSHLSRHIPQTLFVFLCTAFSPESLPRARIERRRRTSISAISAASSLPLFILHLPAPALPARAPARRRRRSSSLSSFSHLPSQSHPQFSQSKQGARQSSYIAPPPGATTLSTAKISTPMGCKSHRSKWEGFPPRHAPLLSNTTSTAHAHPNENGNRTPWLLGGDVSAGGGTGRTRARRTVRRTAEREELQREFGARGQRGLRGELDTRPSSPSPVYP
ncbi:hypothetical protein C8R44DRAFT_881347 [Mycena epipterygia]|nr:hypothetical protein C8R44DRAFT_881347 [Mycena epipterygia]